MLISAQAAFVLAVALFGLGFFSSVTLSNDLDGFEVITDGNRAIFVFRDASNWDAVFGSISIRQLSDSLASTLQEVAALRVEVAQLRGEVASAKSNASDASSSAAEASTLAMQVRDSLTLSLNATQRDVDLLRVQVSNAASQASNSSSLASDARTLALGAQAAVDELQEDFDAFVLAQDVVFLSLRSC
jgi:hypothetical protein